MTMELRKGWLGLLAACAGTNIVTLVTGPLLSGLVGSLLNGWELRHFGVPLMGTATVVLVEAILGVEQSRRPIDIAINGALAAVLGTAVAWLAGLLLMGILWESGVVTEPAFSAWMLIPGNVIAFFAALAVAFYKGVSVPVRDKSVTHAVQVQSQA